MNKKKRNMLELYCSQYFAIKNENPDRLYYYYSQQFELFFFLFIVIHIQTYF